ncbi:hypothetical protein F4859DRAFT_501203 [Xylaria cf. heliscus]|nr:hypothetical protein F4859DRAFT_501203 [Xylaria cf. heliscus]
MDGDLGYHLMATNVPRELLIRRNQQPPHRKQARTWRISTWTTAAASASPRATSTLLSPPIATAAAAAAADADSVAASTSTTTNNNNNNNLTSISTDTDADAASAHASTSASTNTNTNTNTSTSVGTGANPSELDGLEDASPLAPAADLNCTRDTSNSNTNTNTNTNINTNTNTTSNSNSNSSSNHRGRLDGPLPIRECSNPAPTPTSPEQSTAAGRPSFGDHRRLFGRSARRRTTSLTRSIASDTSHTRSSSSYGSSYPGPSSSDQGLPATPRATTSTVPSLTAPSSPDPAQHRQSSRHTDDTVPRQSHTPFTRLYRRGDPFHRRSTRQPPSPSVKPLTSPTRGSGILGYHAGKHSPPILNQESYSIQYPILVDMPSPRNSTVASQSGIMASNETLLSSSAERSGALSTTSIATSTTSRPAISQLRDSRAFVVRNGRTYINDPSLPYPLPVDLPELHRQSLRTLLMFQLFGGPILSSVFASRPPTRVLDVGCGAGFWSMMCHRYFAQHGHSSISFTGLDIVPLGGAGANANAKPDKEMRWQFVQHDIRQLPWPFADGEFDLVMYLRVLKPGGVLEYWETDSIIRMLRPHAPKSTGADIHDDDTSSDGGDDEDNAERMGAYVMTNNTPISQPLNPYLVEYNGWSSKALEARGLSAAPCTSIGPSLLQEAESLTDVHSKRLAVPLSEIRWEREGVGGVVTKDGKSYIDSQKGKFKDQDWKTGSTVTPAQSALRRTALETTVSFILALEPLLREVSLKSQEEWDTWAGKMTNDLLREGGTSWGECLEVGVWTSRKRHSRT